MTPLYASWFLCAGVSAFVAVVLNLWGFALLRSLPALRLGTLTVTRHAEQLLYGALTFSLLAFFAVLLGIGIELTFLGGTVTALAVCVALKVRHGPSTTSVVLPVGRTAQTLNWLGPVLVFAGSLIWSINNIRGLEQTDGGVMLVPWQDFFFHARQVSVFGRFQGDLAGLHWTMYGEPLAPYHYGSYMVPALISRLGGIPAIQIATSVYPILGMALTGAAMLVLAEVTAGAGAALVALALLFFLPDPSSWIPDLGRQYSYFFFQQVGIGGAYAVAIYGLALACALRGRAVGSISLSLLAAGLTLSTALFKVQILLAYGPVFLAVILATAPRLSLGFKIVGTLLIAVGYAIAVSWAALVPNSPTMGASLDGVRRAFGLPIGAGAPVLEAVALLPVGAGGIWMATFGLLLPLCAFLGWRQRRDPGVHTALLLAALFLGTNAYVRFMVNDNRGYGDIAEINRKTFVLPYFVVLYACSILIWREWSGFLARAVHRSAWKIPVAATSALALALTTVAATRLQWWPFSSVGHSRLVVPQGLFDAAMFLRGAAAHDDVVQLCRNDDYIQLSTLAERSSYVAQLVVNAPPLNDKERQRFAALDAVNNQPDFASAARLAQALKISWWLVDPRCKTRWEGARAPAFTSNGYRLYHLRN